MNLPDPLTIKDLVLTDKVSVREALALIDKAAQGIAFAVDGEGRLTGLLTDGDIRRALLAGRTLDTAVAQVMRRDFVSLPVSTPREMALKVLNERILVIPLLDEEGRPVDFASRHRLHRIPVMEPSLGDEELSNVVECLKTGWISSQGPFVGQFEKMFSDFHAGQTALAVSNGTVALHLALVSLGIGQGDEVIVPDLTFAASANAVIHAGAEPVLVDVSADTWTLDPVKVEEALTPRTRAIMPVHLYGHPCDMDPLMALAKKHGLLMIEDCAEALGALYKGKQVGTFGEAGCFSFFGNKLITTGEGGMILFRQDARGDRARRLRDHGMDPRRRYWHTDVGFNYRQTNLQAAVGVAQMGRVEDFIARKLELAASYGGALKDLPGLQLPPLAPWARSVYWLYTVLVDGGMGSSRDEVMRKLLHNGIESRPVFHPLHIMPPYGEAARGRQFPVAERLSRQGLSLPSAVTLSSVEMQRIAQTFARIYGVQELMKEKRRP